MTHSHPAIKAHLTSINCAQNGEKVNRLALFADDAILHDPVGHHRMIPRVKVSVGRSDSRLLGHDDRSEQPKLSRISKLRRGSMIAPVSQRPSTH